MSFRNLLVALLAVSILTACASNENVSQQEATSEAQFSQSTPTATASPIPVGQATDEASELVDELNDLIHPLDTTSAEASSGDLEPVLSAVFDADIVGMGEATHGSSEFVTVRHRLIRGLVQEHGFRHVAFEAPWAGIKVVDQYILGNHDDAESARAGLSYFMIRNEETWELITWLREFNSDSEHSDDPVRLTGIDSQSHSAEAAAFVLEFVKSVDPARLEYFADLYEEILDGSPSWFLSRSGAGSPPGAAIAKRRVR